MKYKRVFLLLGALAFGSLKLMAWGRIHLSITAAAYGALPAWQQDIWAAQRTALINRYCLIPDLAQAPENRAELGPYTILPNGERFSHLPLGRQKDAYLMEYYIEKTVELLQAGDLDGAARYAGCLLHFIEDCGSPAHTMPGDNQLGLLKDLIPTPEEFIDRPLHGLVEEGDLKFDLKDYKPRLLGTSSEEATFDLVERFNPMVRNARSQIIPILQGVFDHDSSKMDAGRLRAATMDADVVTDALYTLLSIAKNRFDPAEVAALKVCDLSSVTPLEVINQSYFPQFTHFSNPYPGYPVRGATLEGGTVRRPLLLNVMDNGSVKQKTFPHGISLGTYSRLTYALPDRVYDRFECLVGLQPELGSRGAVIFTIYVDGAAVYRSGLMTGQDPAAQKVSLPIWGVRELSFSVEGRSKDRDCNYAVIAQPTLFKAEGPAHNNRVSSLQERGLIKSQSFGGR
jgi:hypothetical protein